ncbi:MAG: fumarate hydratase [Thermodesulfovibrionales bacterium]|nr:fumarate hydratase [Thermodesulfovibrionales bacterium]
MLKLRDGIIELYKKVAISIPSDIEEALKTAYAQETDDNIKASLNEMLKKIVLSRKNAIPVCEDPGFPIFFVRVPIGISYQMIRDVIVESTKIATEKIPLKPNAIDSITGENSGNNVGSYFPLIYIEETTESLFIVDLMLRCPLCENMSITYSLPANLTINNQDTIAERNLEGVLKCLLHAVYKNRDSKCSPYLIGVAVGGMRDQVTFLSKRQLLRRIASKRTEENLAAFEEKALSEINNIDISKGRKINALSVKIDHAHHHPHAYFVDISFSCWANRKARLIW